MPKKTFKDLKDARGQKLDIKALGIIVDLLDGEAVLGKTRELLEDLKSKHELRGFLTEGQRVLVRKLQKDYGPREYGEWRAAALKLADLYNEGRLNSESCGFVESVLSQWNETHSWSDLQKEQILTILATYAGDDEVIVEGLTEKIEDVKEKNV